MAEEEVRICMLWSNNGRNTKDNKIKKNNQLEQRKTREIEKQIIKKKQQR